MGGLENAQDFLSQIHTELGYAGYARYKALEDYREAQNRNARLKTQIASIEKTSERIGQNIQNFDFFRDKPLGDYHPFSRLETGDIYMELHGPGSYNESESRWLHVYYDHSKEFSYDDATYKEFEKSRTPKREAASSRVEENLSKSPR